MAATSFIFSLLLLSCFTVFGAELDVIPQALHPYPSHPVIAPSFPPGHHHHHHHHGHPPSYSPVHSPGYHHGHPPAKSPIHPPTPAPVHPPSYHHHGHPPAKSPVHPPTQAPVHPPSHHHHGHPPAKSPVHPPTHAPVHPPSHHGHPPAHAPVKPPTHAPVKPPTHAPVQPPAHSPVQTPIYPPPRVPFPRSFVSVQGVVYCKSCKYTGDTLTGATAIANATVKLDCKNTKYRQTKTATTDKNGYFFVEAPATVTNYGVHKCKVSLVSSPNTACSKKSTLHGGVDGAVLRPMKAYMSGKKPFVLFSVGPFAFEPKCPRL